MSKQSKLTTVLIVAIALWLVFAATPRYQTGQQVFNVTPAQDQATGVLTLPDVPRAGTARLYVGGIRHKPTEDYTISGAAITPVAANVDLYRDPATVLVADYVK